MIDFKLPELGENVAAGDVLSILVKAGDTVAKDQAVLELETDKATIEVPSSVAGKVIEVKVKVGDKVKTGQVILSVEEDGAGAPRRRMRQRQSRKMPRRRRSPMPTKRRPSPTLRSRPLGNERPKQAKPKTGDKPARQGRRPGRGAGRVVQPLSRARG